FTTVMRRPFSRSLRRIWLFLIALIPRGLMTATASMSLNRSAVSLVIRFLTFLLITHLEFRVSGFGFRVKGKDSRLYPKPETRYPNPDSLNVQLHRRRHRALDDHLLEKRALAGHRLHLADLRDHRVDVVDQLGLVEADLADDAVDVSAGVVAEL